MELLERIGHSSASLIEQDLYPVVTRIEVEYRREIKGGPITVSCESGEVSGKRMYIKQRILNERGKPAVEAFIECAFLQGASKRAVPVPVAVRVALEQFFHQ